jgi:hypothetical protein
LKRNQHNEVVGSEVERSDERIIATGEVFTPQELCVEMVSDIPESMLKDVKSTFLDNSAGSGNFLVALQDRLKEYHSLQHINDNMLYAVELMEDNHAELCQRLGVSVDHPHYVCANALEYDYSFGVSLTLEDCGLGKVEQKQKFVPPSVNKEPSAARLFM